MSKVPKIAIIGGGAAGFFAAINAAEFAKSMGIVVDIVIYEATNNCLSKVKVSGGGRCNVTHHQFEISKFVTHYPRGQRELKSPLHQFQAQDTMHWFESKGVALKVEEDGRMFPKSNHSQTIINCFLDEIAKFNIDVKRKYDVMRIEPDKTIYFKNGEKVNADKILLATGSSKSGYELVKSFGHTITPLAPSLFSFKINHPLLKGLSGISFNESELKINLGKSKQFKESGPVLITHWGLSGPAILKLSAWAARELKERQYRFCLQINWINKKNIQDELSRSIKKQLKNYAPLKLSKRFWLNLLEYLNIDGEKNWNELSQKQRNQISETLLNCRLEVRGQNRFKEEFVECGGVKLGEIDFKTMQSKLTPGLYFAGELLDIDGITGGFNFQNAWTTGFIAGQDMVRSLAAMSVS